MCNVINDELNIYISLFNLVNLGENQNQSVVIRRGYAKNNKDKYDPRPEVLGKFDGKNDLLRIAIGKNPGKIKGSNDIAQTHDLEIRGLSAFIEMASIDIDNTDMYNEYRTHHKSKINTNTSDVDF